MPGAPLQVTLGLDLERDRFEWERLELPEISMDYIRTVLAERYGKAGFCINEAKAGLAVRTTSELKPHGAGDCKEGSSRSLSALPPKRSITGQSQ